MRNYHLNELSILISKVQFNEEEIWLKLLLKVRDGKSSHKFITQVRREKQIFQDD